MRIRTYHPSDQPAVIALWQRCNLVVPANDPVRDLELKQQFQPDMIFVGTIDDRIVASVMVGYDGHRGWINYLGVDPEYQRRGLGRQLVAFVEEKVRSLGCPKLNLNVRTSNKAVIAFYESLGYRVDEVIGMGKRFV